MTDYLFDSDVLINHLRYRKDFRSYLPSLKVVDSFGCSVISVAEVYSGMLPAEEAQTRALIESLVHYPVDFSVAVMAADLRKEHRRKGITLSLDDLLIGATALIQRAVLVTCNMRHYPMLESIINANS